MKRIMSILSLCMVIFCMTACDNTKENSESQTETASSEISESESKAETSVTENNTDIVPEIEEEKTADGKILIAYFSATGTTKEIAEALASETGGDIFEIVPVQPYSSDDLNYSNDDCRANREQNDDKARPEISGNIDNMNDYSTVFIGYPIWWGIEPHIIDTFMESYDLSSKTVIPFCTSGGSGISASESNLNEMCPNAKWLDGKRFSGTGEVSEWIDKLNVN